MISRDAEINLELTELLTELNKKIRKQKNTYEKQMKGKAKPHKQIDPVDDTIYQLVDKAHTEISKIISTLNQEAGILPGIIKQAEKIITDLSEGTKDLPPSNPLYQFINYALSQLKDFGNRLGILSWNQDETPVIKTNAHQVAKKGKTMLTSFQEKQGVEKLSPKQQTAGKPEQVDRSKPKL